MNHYIQAVDMGNGDLQNVDWLRDALTPKWVQAPRVFKTHITLPIECDVHPTQGIVAQYPLRGVDLIAASELNTATVLRWCVPGEPWHERKSTEKMEWAPDSVTGCTNQSFVMQDVWGNLTVWNQWPSSGEAIAKDFNKLHIVAYLILPTPPALASL